LNLPCVSNFPGNLGLFIIVNLPIFILPQRIRKFIPIIRDRLSKHALLVNSFWGLEMPRDLPPSVQLIGTLGTVDTSFSSEQESSWKNYPDIKNWLDQSQNDDDIVFLTTGSHAFLSETQVKTFFEGLYCDEKKSQEGGKRWRFIWSLQDKYLSFLPSQYQEIKNDNYYLLIKPWVPQCDLIQHPKVKVVLTHCGWGGVSEVIGAGKPIVGVPFMADQPRNAEQLVHLGVGLSLNVNKFTSIQVRSAVTEVLTNPNYTIKMKELQALEAVSSRTTANKVVDAVEYARRFGSKNLIVKRAHDWKKIALTAGALLVLKSLVFVLFFLLKHRRRHRIKVVS